MGKGPTEADIERIADKYGDISGTNFDDKILTTEKGKHKIKLSDIWTPGNSIQDPPSTTLQPGETATAEKNEYYDGESEKPAIIPGGFTVSNVEGEKTINGGLVIYYIPEGTQKEDDFWTADTDGDGTIDVREEYNQYVWIPVDGIIGEDGTTIADVDGTKAEKKILLGRYNFEFAIDGTPSEYSPSGLLGSHTEDTSESHDPDYGNKIATDIEGFIQSVRDNHGYYIARYEAGVENAELDISDMISSYKAPNDNWTGYSGENMKMVSKAGVQAWNYVTQNKASELCQNLYSGVNSDLVNSYAWDTAILFIQKYSGDSDYSRQEGYSTTPSQPANTGEGILVDTNEVDKQCNIYDMAGNCHEWTTETNNDSYDPCVYRGGNYGSSTRNLSFRYAQITAYSYSFMSFRSLLYL